MMNNLENDYNWKSSKRPSCFNYYEKKVVEQVKYLNPKKILDIGSGNGYLCNVLNNYCEEIVGIEPSKIGYKISTKEYTKIKFYNISCYDDPSKLKQKFDLVISTEVIEHLFYPKKLIEFANSCLKKNGHLILTTPYHGYLKNLAISLLNGWDRHFMAHRDGGHIKFWSTKTLNKLLQSYGFSDLKNIGVGRVPYLRKGFITVAKK